MSLDGPQQLTGYRLHNYDDAITRLVASRESQGISQRKLAAHIGIAQATLSENLRGLHRMDALTLLLAADALGYDLALIPRKDTP